MENEYYNKKVDNDIPLMSSERNTIITWIYNTHIVEYYTTYLLKRPIKKLEDKVQDIYLFICELPQTKWDDLYEQGERAILSYVTGIIHQQLVSDHSRLYKKYDRYEKTQVTQDSLFWELYDKV